MARRKDAEGDSFVPMYTCGQCAKAYGFCCPGYDGSPIACRCPERPEFLRMCSEAACGVFAMRESPAPETVTEGWPKDLSEVRSKGKVVPLFRKGESRPWKLVPVSEIPPQGISWDGMEMK